jgi:geranylgeranyl reductase family protein
VVGAGPAGSLAAGAAASSGARTLLLDRAEFPRYKTCGGGLIGVSLAALPVGVHPTIRDHITAATFTNRGRFLRTRREDMPILQMVCREEFDNELAETAVASGTDMRTGVLVRAVVERPGKVVLVTSRGTVEALAVVGADGSASRIGGYVGVQCEEIDLGLELEIEAGRRQQWRGRVHLDWGPLPGSYGWLFPKGDRLTVGVIVQKGTPGSASAYLGEYVSQLGLAKADVVRSSGHLTRCRVPQSPLSRGRVLVAGDAAGLLEPWTREGISYALRSGRCAGKAAALIARASTDEAVAAVADDYRREIDRTLGAEMKAGRQCLRAFTRRPGMFHAAVVGTKPGWAGFCRIGRGETTVAALMQQRSVALAVDLVAR